MQNCPNITILILFGLVVFLSFLSFCTFVFLSFCLLSDQMSEGSQVSKVNLCVQILNGQALTARAAKKNMEALRIVPKQGVAVIHFWGWLFNAI